MSCRVGLKSLAACSLTDMWWVRAAAKEHQQHAAKQAEKVGDPTGAALAADDSEGARTRRKKRKHGEVYA